MEALASHLPLFALVLSRMSGLFIFAPLLSSAIVPRQFKVLLALALSAAIYPAIDHAAYAPGAAGSIGLIELAPLMAGELLIGLSIGVLAVIPLMTAQLAGLVMGQQMGLGLASVYDPTVDFESDSLGQLLFFAALAAYLAAGGLDVVFATLADTFARIPAGGLAASDAPLALLTAVVASGFEVAVRMAMPVLVILFLESIALGFIMKSVPSINIMTFGFPVRIILGVLLVLASLAISLEVLMTEVGEGLHALRQWPRSVSADAAARGAPDG